MKGRRLEMPITGGLLASIIGIAACSLVTARPALPEEGAPDTSVSKPPAEKPAAVPEGASGLTIHIDPQTGVIRQAPAPGAVPLQLPPRQQNSLSTSHEGLVEVPNPVPGGGVKLDLQGRFQSPLIGTIDANGKVNMHHLGEPPEPGDKK